LFEANLLNNGAAVIGAAIDDKGAAIGTVVILNKIILNGVRNDIRKRMHGDNK